MDLIWRSGSRLHDWAGTSHLQNLLSKFASVSLIGDVSWLKRPVTAKRKTVELGAGKVPDAVAGWMVDGVGSISIGGVCPVTWALHLIVSEWDNDRQEPSGANLATLRVDSSDFSDGLASEPLFNAFLGAHGPDDTEFAFIHPYAQYMHLAGEVYKPPLVNSHMIAGAYWATFIGPGQIEFFDSGGLQTLSATRVHAFGADAVSFQSLQSVEEATTETGLAELLRLTTEMRRALRRPG